MHERKSLAVRAVFPDASIEEFSAIRNLLFDLVPVSIFKRQPGDDVATQVLERRERGTLLINLRGKFQDQASLFVGDVLVRIKCGLQLGQRILTDANPPR